MERSAWLAPRSKSDCCANTIMRISDASHLKGSNYCVASRAFVRPVSSENNLGVAVSRATPIPHFASLGSLCGLLNWRFDVASVRVDSGSEQGSWYCGMTGEFGEMESWKFV
jgi:hypothetical protein